MPDHLGDLLRRSCSICLDDRGSPERPREFAVPIPLFAGYVWRSSSS
jgi:hypothetical protein